MPSILVPYPAGQASTRFFRFIPQVLQPTRRHQTTYRRSRSKLNIKPDATFLPSKTEPHDHIIFNPPPSMPNVYHTPVIFLPKDDKRRQMHNALKSSNLQMAITASSSGSTELAPPIRQPEEKKYHVTPAQMDEMRALRLEDPYEWSVTKLAKKYDCANIFVRWVVAGLAPEKMAQQKLVSDVVKSRWGAKRRIAREDRQIRKERWMRDA